MKTIEYTGVQSPWYDTLGGSGLTWTTGMQAELKNDVADELLGYVTIFKFIRESGSAVTLPNIRAAYDSGSAEEKAAFQSSVSGYVAVATFPDLLAARAAAVAGRKFVCAAPVIQGGLPFSRWVYDGTEMRLDGPQDILVDLAPAVGVLGTSEQILRKYLLPAGLFQVLRYTQAKFIFAKSGVTDAMSAIRMRIGTAGTSADLAVIGDTALTAPNRQRSIESVFSFPDANTMRFQLTQVAGFGGTAVNGTAYPQQSTIVAGYGSALYLSLTAQMAGSTDTPSSPSLIITAG